MHVISHNWSAMKQRLHKQSVAEISRHSVLSGDRIRQCETSHFQWSWTTPNLVVKVTPFFDTEYLTSGYRYGHSYYIRQIGNRTQIFEWHQFQWYWSSTLSAWVGSFCCCSKLKVVSTSKTFKHKLRCLAPMGTDSVIQSISPALKSPPTITVALGLFSVSLKIYSRDFSSSNNCFGELSAGLL